MDTGLRPSIDRAPADRGRRVLLVNALDDPADFLFFNNVSQGLLSVEAGIRAACPEVDTRIVIWHAFHRGDPGGRIAAFDRLLEDYRPAVVGISSFSMFMPLALSIAARVRAYDPRVPVILGGVHATAFPSGAGRYADLDWYVSGEGCRVGGALVARLLDGGPAVDGIGSLTFRRDGRVVSTPAEVPPPDMDANPAIDWSRVEDPGLAENDVSVIGLDDFLFRFHGRKLFPYETSQGCTHACRFCERVGRRLRRRRSPGRVVADLRAIRERFGIRHFFLSDDLVHADRDRFVELLDAVAPLGMGFYAAVKGDEIDFDLVDRMIDSGVRMLHFFPESGSARVRSWMGKRLDLPRLLANAARASARGAMVFATFIVGWPGETLEEAQATVRLAAEPCFDFVNFMPLLYFGAAPVGRHLADVGVRPDTPEYFRLLRNPYDICLARYDRETYVDLVGREHDLNRVRLSDPRVVAKLAALDVEVVPLGGRPVTEAERGLGAARPPAARPAAAGAVEASPGARLAGLARCLEAPPPDGPGGVDAVRTDPGQGVIDLALAVEGRPPVPVRIAPCGTGPRFLDAGPWELSYGGSRLEAAGEARLRALAAWLAAREEAP